MPLMYALYYGVILCWILNIYFLALFALNWHEKEPEKPRAWLTIAVLAALAAGLAFLLPARGGYDNNHDFLCLGQEFFTSRPGIMLSFKEVSPLFTDGISDFLSANSLFAVLCKNRLLQIFSIFVFFSGLRRLGRSITVSAVSAAFLFLNFLSLLNASSFSTTSSNLLIWLTSLLAVFDAYSTPDPGPEAMVWIMSSLVLVISARIEFLPVNLLFIAGLIVAKAVKGNRFFFKPGNLAVIAAGACLAVPWALHALNPDPAKQIGGIIQPYVNFLYQLGARNLGVLAGVAPKLDGLHKLTNSFPTPACSALCLALVTFAFSGILAGCLADRKSLTTRLAALALLLLWIGYFSAIFQPMDFYPLHFMRHQLYFFTPFAYLFAMGLDGFECAAGAGGKRIFSVFCLLAFVSYTALNAKTALSFNRELRTNDRELDFLMKAQREWPAQTFAVHPIRNRSNARAELIQKYFPAMPDCPGDSARSLLKYVSPEPRIFSDSATGLLEQAPLLAEPPSSAWKAVTFKHAFYTAFTGRVTETEEPVPLTIGFFKFAETGRDRAFLETLDGACSFDSGDYREAGVRFGRAVAADPACLNCKYFLALSYAAERKKEAAQSELIKIEKISGAKIPPAHRALIENLARGETGKAAEMAREISNADPEFFFRKNFFRRIQELNQGTMGQYQTSAQPDRR